jgi:dihydrolipoamide dehydrogenase
MSQELDLVILGGGPGGYVAAVRAAQLGLKVAVVEKEKLGGVCLHKGCIPTKTLLRSAEIYATAKEGEEYGLHFSDLQLDFAKIQARKTKVIDQLHKGVQHLMKKGKIKVYEGIGRIMGPSIFSPQAGAISVQYPNGESEILVPKNVIIATGSSPRNLPGLNIDGNVILNSDHALELKELPASMIIVGGGVIGVEWASMLSDFGVEVTVVEYMDRILPFEDEEISKELARLFKKKNIKILTGAKLLPDTVKIQDGKVSVSVERKGSIEEVTAEKMLVSVGRSANIEGIGLENTEIKTEKGYIVVNQYFQTNESHIYAIGDVVGGLQLAHVASHEGIVAVEHIAGRNPSPINYTMVPKCTYSRPEVASVGLTEAEAKERGFKVKTGKMQFRAIGKALVYGETDGFVKMVMDEESNDLLGVHMIGPHVTDLISEAGLAMVLNATPWEISHTIHPHPTLSEVIGEAALAVEGEPIHG